MNIEVILANYDFSQVQVLKSIAPLLLAGLIVGAISLAVGIYTFLQMRKMQKKNRPKPNQIDGTIADEGVSFCDIAGSPHIHPNITDLWNKKSEAIKQKSGGFLGIGKSSQVTGYRYYTSFAAFIGNRIEKFIAINFDNRGWIVHDPTKHPVNMLPINAPSLFGQDAGGVVGNIDLEFGFPQPQQNLAYKQHFDLVSAYPYQSYLVFRGNTIDHPFYFGNSNYMKEMLLWVKRTRVRNDGQGQWYEVRGDGAVVCEIGGEIVSAAELITPEMVGRGQVVIKTTVSPGPATVPEYTDTYRFPVIASGLNYSDSRARLIEETIGDNYPPGVYEFAGTITYSSSDFPQGISAIGSNVKVISINIQETSTARRFLFKVIVFASGRFGIKFVMNNNVGAIVNYSARHVTSGSYLLPTQSPDINPIHKIREILTDDTAMAKPETDVSDQNFIKAADRIYDEGLGISWAIDEKSCIDAIEELCYHIEAGIRVNRQTGLYEMVLFRDDWFAEDEIHSIAENKIKDLSLEVMNSDDIVNQLNVTYYDRERIKNSTFSIYENGSILTMGKANAESIDFPYFMNMRNAEIVANWKLKQYSTPAWKGTLTTGWREARKWNRYDLVEITWSKKWQGTILARIMKIDLGNGLNNEVMIDFEEVVPYSGEMNTSIVVDDSTEEKAEPAKPAIGETFEAPYYIAVQNIGQRKIDEELAYNPDVGFTFSTYRRPQWNALYTEITTINADNPENGWVVDGNAEFVTGGQFDQVVSRTATQIPVKNLQIEGLFGSGDLIVAGTWLAGINGLYEFMIVESFDSETNILTVRRGALDTLPTQWDIDGWFFVSNADDGLFSLTEYSAGDNVRASSLTVTPSSKLEQLGSAPVYMRSRAIRPYPPANVKINGEYWPSEVTGNLELTWSHRNRLQQTGGMLLGWYESSVTVENGVKYAVEVYDNQTNALLYSLTDINADNMTIDSNVFEYENRIELYAVRSAYNSLQRFVHVFTHGAAKWTPSNLLNAAKIWGNADNVIVDSSNRISLVTDLSGNNFNLAQPINAQKPLLINAGVRKAMRFDAVDDCLQIASGAALDISKNTNGLWIFVVAKKASLDSVSVARRLFVFERGTSNSTRFGLFSDDGTGNSLNKYVAGVRRLDADTYQYQASSNTVTTDPTILCSAINYSDGQLVLAENGVNFGKNIGGTANTSNTSSTKVTLGGQNGLESFNGDIYEFIVGNGILTSSERQKLEGWAAHKYSLTANLPAGHPYKDRAPTVED